MRILCLLLLLCGCATVRPGPPFDAAQLAGTWHVVATNFPMWLDGQKTNPTFHYGVLGDGKLSDTVRYVEDGAPGFIEGIDTQLGGGRGFRWRGTGLLVLFVSDWEVAAIDPAGEWAVVSFSKTLATPEGVDVIRRTKGPPPEEALAAIAADPELKARAEGLKPLVAP